jgi:hypothetical protein
MKKTTLIYAVVCLLLLGGLTFANARGFVPFSSNARQAARGATAGHFHK